MDDDYIKFIALGQHYIEKNGNGVLTYISNNSFLDGVTHRQIRRSLMESFDKIYIVNLHGNSRTHETAPDGTKDENVFDIRTGVSINIFIKTSKSKKLADVYYCDLYGKRNIKYDFLTEHSLQNSGFTPLKPIDPYYFFTPKDFSVRSKYGKGFYIKDIFRSDTTGVETQNDFIAIQFEKETILNIIKDFQQMSLEQIRTKYKINKDGRDWVLKDVQNNLQSNDYNPNKTTNIAYRPFDIRYTYYTDKRSLIAYPRFSILQCMLNKNFALCLPRSNKRISVFVTQYIADKHYIGDQTYIFPLYIYTNDDKTPNLNPQIVQEIESKVGQTTPESIFDYIYGVLHSPSYREKYREFLKIDFPRIPYPENKDKFEHYCKYGEQLRKLHLMTEIPPSSVTFPIGGDCVVDKPVYNNGRVYINKTQYFDNVPQSAWEFYVGGYQPAQKYLKDRKGRTLTQEEVMHYENIITVLQETDRIMQEIG